MILHRFMRGGSNDIARPGSIQQHRWHPSIQGSLANLSWDENSKPIPLLCLEQLEDQPETSKPRSTRTRLSVGDRTPV